MKALSAFEPSKWRGILVTATVAVLAPFAVQAQSDTDVIEEIIVTGVARATTKLESSVSVSSLPAEDVYEIAPRSIAEIFRSLPGIRSESSGGSGNANITIRGIPLATGGSKFLQLHEDGLPVVEFGDLNFANADNFLRYDWSVDRIESIRGGSASTLASNSPGGIINLISKTGKTEGGAIGVSLGLDYDEFRTDFDYGGAINDSMYFHIGGFYRDGEGVRDSGFNGDSGGQIKANITREFDNGFLRFYGKYLNDRVTTYLPAPVRVISNGNFGSVPNFDASSQTLHSANYTNLSTFDAFGNPVNRDLTDGIESIVSSFGFEAEFDVAQGWTLNNKFRTSEISGGFISPFTDTFGPYGPQPAQSMADTICANTTLATGAPDCSNTTVTLSGGGAYTGLAYLDLLFDTTFKDVGNLINDLNISREFDGGVTVTLGYYFSKQNIAIDWNSWQTLIQTVDGTNSENLHIVTADGAILVDNGIWAPSFLSWSWDLQYQTTAPYINVGFDVGDRLKIDVSARQDNVQANGELIAICCGGNADFDINGNGVLDPQDDADNNIAFFSGGVINLNRNATTPTRVNYDTDEISFSLGGSYLLTDSMTVFARYSDGNRALADRLLQIGGALQGNGALATTTNGFDNVQQLEIGYKWQAEMFDVYATFFDTTTEDTQAEVTSGNTFVREYQASGIELEGNLEITDGFTVSGNLTWTDAEISDDFASRQLLADADPTNDGGSIIGNTPRRQADVIWTITPKYATDQFVVGASIQGSTDYFTQDVNSLKQDGYNLVHLFATYNISDTLSVSANINNVTDEFIVTETEEGAAANGAIVRGRPLSGTSSVLSFRYTFE